MIQATSLCCVNPSFEPNRLKLLIFDIMQKLIFENTMGLAVPDLKVVFLGSSLLAM